MKTIMIIGAGVAQVPLIKTANIEGYHTVVCDIDQNAPGVTMADEYFKVSTKDRNGLFNVAKTHNIDGIVANSEYAMVDVAYISSKLGLVGNSEEAISVLSSKSQFRELQRRVGLFAPAFIPNITSTPVKTERFEYPLIIKPDESSGTRGTTLVKSTEDDINKAVHKCTGLSRNGLAIIEEYVSLPTLSGVEGELFIHNGEIIWDGLFTSIRSHLAPMIPMTYIFPCVVRDERIGELKRDLKTVFDSIGVTHGEYNIEAFFVGDTPFIIEINPRQGGNDLPRYVQKHCGINYYRLLVTTAVGDDSYWDDLRNYKRNNAKITHHMLYPRKDGFYRGLCINKNIENMIFATETDVKIGQYVKKTADGSSSIGYVDFYFTDTDEQMVISRRLEEFIDINVDENSNNNIGNCQ